MATKNTKKPEPTSMKDYAGNDLQVGDEVVYIRKGYCSAELCGGKIEKFKLAFGKVMAVVDTNYGGTGVTSSNVFKVGGNMSRYGFNG